MRRAAFLLLLLAVAAPPLAAGHGGAVDDAVDALETTPVYVEPRAEPTLTDAQAQALADRIRASGRAIYVAVIDQQEEPGHEVVHELVGGLGKPGTYVVVAGGDFGVHSTEFDHSISERLQAEAAGEPEAALASTLDGLVAEVEQQAAPADEDDDSAPWVWIVVGLVAIGLVAAGATLWALRRSRRAGTEAPQPPPAA